MFLSKKLYTTIQPNQNQMHRPLPVTNIPPEFSLHRHNPPRAPEYPYLQSKCCEQILLIYGMVLDYFLSFIEEWFFACTTLKTKQTPPPLKALKPHAAGMRIDNQDRAVEIVVYGQSARVGGCLCYPLKRVFCGDHGRVQIKGVDLRSLRTFHGLF